ncbi:glycosyltransferase family 4 protein [Kordiimonas sp.]|uniref:glycosyltransferase family 4 protein n=1 Tax=Kordiimonas sp. TaxID=1970157 RepID=UPI003B517C80
MKGERVIVYLPSDIPLPKNLGHSIELRHTRLGESNLIGRALWYWLVLSRVIKREAIDVLFCPGGMLPKIAKSRCKTIVAFRNMLPFAPQERKRYPLGYVRARLLLLKFLQSRSFKKADHVIFISRFAKSVIDQFLGGKQEGGASVIPHGINEAFRSNNVASPDKKSGDRYVLYVSILDVYKSQLQVVEAWSLLRKMKPDIEEKLYLVGPEYPAYGAKVRLRIEQLGLQEEVKYLGAASYSQLPKLYREATINLFASSCENCPNILLEALASGTPILCSNYPPMPEFAGEAVLYFDPYSPHDAAQKLFKLLVDEDLRGAMAKKALYQSRGYDWRQTANQTWRLLRFYTRGQC